MPKRIRLGTVTNGTLDSEDARFEIDGNGNLVVDVADGDVLPGSNDPSLGASSDPWPETHAEESNLDTATGTGWDASSLPIRGASMASTLADDSTATFLSTTVDRFTAILTVTEGTNTTSALLRGRAASTPAASVIAQDGDDTIETTTSDVGGTDGTDGNLTVSVRDGAIEVENRLGGAATVELTVIGGG